MPNNNITRCQWCSDDSLYQRYHDLEWGVPCHDENKLFEMLILEGFQAGLSWITVLRKRGHYRHVLKGFDPQYLANLTDDDLESLLHDSGLIRNRLKIFSLRSNALAYLKLVDECGGLNNYLWAYVDGKAIINQWQTLAEIPTQTPLSETIAKDLKKRGFKFVGPTIIYAYMQAIGMVMDHTVNCFRYKTLTAKGIK